MKYLITFLILTLCLSCSSLKLKSEKSNSEFSDFKLNNVLVIGVSQDTDIRKEFEFKFVRQLNKSNVNALQSAVVFEPYFKESEEAEDELQKQIKLLRSKGYNTILLTKVTGVEENTSYSGESIKIDYHLRQFIGYYLMYQNMTKESQKYDSYQVYHIQSSIYALNTDSDMSLVWAGFYDLINIGDTHKIIDKYIKRVIKSLEKAKYIEK